MTILIKLNPELTGQSLVSVDNINKNILFVYLQTGQNNKQPESDCHYVVKHSSFK